MAEPHDPLRSLFQEAAAAGRSRADLPPVSDITRRGRKAHRTFVTAVAVTATLVVAGAGAAALVHRSQTPTPPATVPSVPSLSPDSSEPPVPSETTAPDTTDPTFSPSFTGSPTFPRTESPVRETGLP
ncbi:cell wall synthesis protein CwsA, partial [Streptomyces sp. NPDC059063]